jgi:hypothetical protein
MEAEGAEESQRYQYEAMAKAGIKVANGITALNKVLEDNKDALDEANEGSPAYAEALG